MKICLKQWKYTYIKRKPCFLFGAYFIVFGLEEFKIIAVEFQRDEYENLNFGNHMHFNAKNQEQFFKMIDTFRKGIG